MKRTSPEVQEERRISGKAKQEPMEEGTENRQEKEECSDAIRSSIDRKRKSSADLGKERAVSKCAAKGNGIDEHEPKRKKDDAVDIHAESQRLLRDTKGVAFAPEPLLQKPLSSLIEKIRQRKLQLANSGTKMSTSSLGDSSKIPSSDLKDATELNREVEVVMHTPPSRVPFLNGEASGPSTSGIGRDESLERAPPLDDLEVGEGNMSRPRTPDTRTGRSISNSACKSPTRSFLRAPLLESQDLYSDSQLSPLRDDSQGLGAQDEAIPAAGFRMSLHLNSETQDDDHNRYTEDDNEKENRDPTESSSPDLFPTVSHVRGLIDDEAEDEDDDPLEDEDEGDEDEAARELRDLLTEDVGERPADIERRANLHSKWLEQQDLAMEDNILHRIENGWRNKGRNEVPSFLNDTKEIGFTGSNSRISYEGNSKVSETTSVGLVNSVGAFRSSTSMDGKGQIGAHLVDQFQESSDDEEAEEKLRHQLFLEESEEKTEFLSVDEDESSRGIFKLIHKVNVSTVKPRTAAVHNELRTNATSHQSSTLQHQSSFLRRKVTATLTTTKQGSGTSRSYIFCRDDSNSRDTNQSDKQEPQTTKENSTVTSSDDPLPSTKAGFNGQIASKVRGSLATEEKPRGPSLFQVLKRQAADLASGKCSLGLNGSSSSPDDLSIFSAMRPSRQPKGSLRK